MQWCVGMYSSGSTWLVHALRCVGNVHFPDEPRISAFADTADQLPTGWLRSDRLIIKSHEPDQTTATLLLRRADRIWVSIRDPRDSVASVMTYMHECFDSAFDAVANSARQCEHFCAESKAVLLRYEDAFIDDPATLDRIAAGFSRTLSSQQRDLLFQQTRRSSIERMILTLDPSETVEDGVPGHRVHTETQWHTHHVNRTGEIGRWRHTLDKAQTIEVEQRLQSWMERFGYVP
jgi:sulfotransferase family protein